MDELIVTEAKVLSDARCQELIEEAEEIGFRSAPITTPHGSRMAPEVRNNTRVMLDDRSMANALWPVVNPHLVPYATGWEPIGLNERFRFYRYEPGQYFDWHGDGPFVRDECERSMITAIFYLNENFVGGTTDFDIGYHFEVRPSTGMLLLFAHPLVHRGSEVSRGTKYVLRTDVMYRQTGEQ